MGTDAPIMVDITKPCDGYCSGPDRVVTRDGFGAVTCDHCKRPLVPGNPWDKFVNAPAKPPMPQEVAELVHVVHALYTRFLPELSGTPAEGKMKSAIAAVKARYAEST